MIYLATPYTHPDPTVRQARFDAVNRAAAQLMQEGWHVFSPITHSHPIALISDIPTDWDHWRTHCIRMLSICDRLYILKLEGWDTSVGVSAETLIAKDMNLPIVHLIPEGMGVIRELCA